MVAMFDEMRKTFKKGGEHMQGKSVQQLTG